MNEQMQQVLGIIQGAQNHQDREAVQRCTHAIQQYAADPAFNACLASLATTASLDVQLRAQAALLLKRNAVRFFKAAIAPNVVDLKGQMLTALGDAEPVRKAAAQVVNELAKHNAWPALVPELWGFMRNAGPDARLGVLKCVCHICEDCPELMEEKRPGARPFVETLVPDLLRVVSESKEPSEVLMALEAVHFLLCRDSTDDASPTFATFRKGLPQLLDALERCVKVSGEWPKGGELMCNALGCYKQCLYFYDELKATNRLPGIMNLVFSSTTGSSEAIALAACEFWYDLAQTPAAVNDLKCAGMLPQVLSLLLNKTAVSDADFAAVMDDETADQVRPRTQRKKKKGDDGAEEVEQWTLRRCAYEALGHFAATDPEAVITPPQQPQGWLLASELLPRLQDGDWKVQEAAMTALGAVGEAAYQHMMESLRNLLPHMLNTAQSGSCHFMVRASVFWALGKCAKFLTESPVNVFDGSLTCVLGGLKAPERRVQEGAVRALNAIVGLEAENPNYFYNETAKYFMLVAQAVGACLNASTTSRNLVAVFDTVSALAALFPTELASPQGHELVMLPMMQLLGSLPVTENVVLPEVLGCLGYCAEGMQAHFAMYIPATHSKALEVLAHYFTMLQKVAANPALKEDDMGSSPENAFEAVKAIAEVVLAASGAGEAKKLLVETKCQNLSAAELAFVSLTCDSFEMDEYVVSSAVSLVGTFLASIPEVFLSHCIEAAPQLMRLVSGNTYAAKDTAWLCGEIALVAREKTSPDRAQEVLAAIDRMAMHMIPLLGKPWDETVLQTMAIALAKCGLAGSPAVHQAFPTLYSKLVRHVSAYSEEEFGWEDKNKGFLGILYLLSQNFRVLATPKNIEILSLGMSRCAGLDENEELLQGFVHIVQNLKREIEPSGRWMETLKRCEFPAAVLIRVN